MPTLQDICIDTITKKGYNGLLNEKFPPILYQLLVDKIKAINKPIWLEKINLVHMDLLIETKKMDLVVETKRGELNFTYISFQEEDYSCFKIQGITYPYLDDCTKKIYYNTIKYLKSKSRFERIENDLQKAKNIFRRMSIPLR